MKVTTQRSTEKREVVWSGAAESSAVTVSPGASFAIYLPAAYNSGSPGTLGVQQMTEIVDPDTWVDVYSAGSVMSIAVTPGKMNVLTTTMFVGAGTIRFKSNDGVQTLTAELVMNS